MKRWVRATLLAITVAAADFPVGVAQDSTAQIARVEGPQSPNRQGFDPYTIPEIMKRFHIPGVSMVVEHDFQVQWTKTYGVADVVTNAPVAADTLFQAASISKPTTAFAVLRAVEAGRVSLDENVNKF